jgi:hypothetical protein
MTDPTPTPGAPADPTTQPPAAPPTPRPTPPAPSPSDPVDVDSLPANVQAMIKKLRDENAKNRIDPKAAAEEARKQLAADVAKALGLADEEPDPAELAEQIEQAQNKAWSAHVELQVYKLAPSLGADGDALLDSLAFINSLDDLVDMDPRSAEFKEAIKAKVQEAAAKYPAKTGQAPANGPRPDPSQGGRGGAPARTGNLSQAIAAHYGRR